MRNELIKKQVVTVAFLFVSTVCFCQVKKPVKNSVQVVKDSATENTPLLSYQDIKSSMDSIGNILSPVLMKNMWDGVMATVRNELMKALNKSVVAYYQRKKGGNE